MGDSVSRVAPGSQEVEVLYAGKFNSGDDDGSPRDDGDVVLSEQYTGRPVDTLVIFDWDDTLLCSSAINQRKASAMELVQLEQAGEAALSTAMRLGETVIITNGNGSWVEDSSCLYLPGLRSTLDRIQVSSARAQHENCFPGDPLMWKRLAFRDLLARRREGRPASHAGVNLIVIGDGQAEMEAAQSATKVLEGVSLVKTVKFKEEPSVTELIGQLRRVEEELGTIVRWSRSASKGLVQRPLPDHLSHRASRAAGWEISQGKVWGGAVHRSGLWPLFVC